MSEKMPVSRHTRTLPFRLKALSAVVLSTALLSSAAYGASLGRINVLSALGQPLQADIELHSTTREQAENLKIRLAPLETFRIANIEYNPVLSGLRFNVEDRNGRPVIRVSSTRPINEPFVDLLLEVEGSGGRLVREYTFILDPVDIRKAQPVQMAAPAPVAPARQSNSAPLPSPAPVAQIEPAVPAVSVVPAPEQPAAADPAPLAQRSAPAARTTPQAAEATSDAASSHTVMRGDTLGKIAREVAHEGVSLDQMLVALHRANPQAFVDNNMNRLRSGRILTIPDAEAARTVTAGEARSIVIAQAADFNQYKERLASQVASSAPVAGEVARQSDGGRITAQVEETGSPTAAAQDRLQLSKSGVAAGGDRSGTIPAGAEERIAQEKALAEANARIAELEHNLTAMQRLLQLQNQELAERQAQAQPAAGQQAAVVTPVVASAAETEMATATNPDAAAPEETATLAPAAEAPQVAAQSEAAVSPAPAAKPPVVAVPPIVEEPSFLEHMLGHPLLLPLTGVLAALGLVGVVVRRRRKQQEALARDSFVQGNSLFGSTGGQSVDTNNSVFSTNFSPSASQLDTNEVDPIAEADVYIAYQKDDQAEEILKDALRAQPARHNVRLKLLEIYKRRKDAVAFAICAQEMHALTHGRGEDWLQAAILGRELDPDNSLYAKTSAAADGAEQDNPSTEELDLGALLNSTRMPGDAPEEGALAMTAGGMSFGSEPRQAADNDALDFNLHADEDAADTAGAESPLNEWDVENDIAQMKAEAEKSQPAVSFLSADGDDDDITVSNADKDNAADKPLDFDISDISLDLNSLVGSSDQPAQAEETPLTAKLGDQMQEFVDPLAELVPSAGENEAASDQDNGDDIVNPFDVARPAKQFAAAQVVQEPLLDLDIPELPASASSTEQNDLGLSSAAGGVSLGNEGQMWEDSEDEVALAQATVPVPAMGSISAEAELSTKLDLAVAYREIGDKEGARELLEEVVASGHPEYTGKAKNLLQKIA